MTYPQYVAPYQGTVLQDPAGSRNCSTPAPPPRSDSDRTQSFGQIVARAGNISEIWGLLVSWLSCKVGEVQKVILEILVVFPNFIQSFLQLIPIL